MNGENAYNIIQVRLISLSIILAPRDTFDGDSEQRQKCLAERRPCAFPRRPETGE